MKLVSENEQVFLENLAERLRQEGVSCLLLRGFENLPSQVENDLDFLVSDARMATTICLELAKEFKFDASVTYRRYCLSGVLVNSWLQLDFFTRLVKRWAPYLDGDQVLQQSAEAVLGLPKICGSDYVAMTAAKEILTYGYIRKRKYLAIKSIIFRDASILNSVDKSLQAHFTRRSVDRIMHHINDRDFRFKKFTVRRKFQYLFSPVAFFKWLYHRLRR